MTPGQAIGLHEAQAELFARGAEAAVAGANYHLAAFNYGSCFRAHLMAALMQWRHRVASPVERIRESLTVARAAVEALRQLDATTPVWLAFDPAHAVFLSYLLHGSIDASLKAVCVSESDPRARRITHIRQAMDVLVLDRLANGDSPQSSIEGIAGSDKRLDHARRSYANYLALVAAGRRGDLKGVIDGYRRGADFYRAREKDSYYSSAPIEGGGMDNQNCVDFRLAALVRGNERAIVDDVETPGTIHLWGWG